MNFLCFGYFFLYLFLCFLADRKLTGLMNITWSHVIVHRNFAHCLENNFHAISPSPSLHVQYSFIQIFSLKYCNKTNFPSDQFPAMLSHFLQRNFVKSNFCQDYQIKLSDQQTVGLMDYLTTASG